MQEKDDKTHPSREELFAVLKKTAVAGAAKVVSEINLNWPAQPLGYWHLDPLDKKDLEEFIEEWLLDNFKTEIDMGQI